MTQQKSFFGPGTIPALTRKVVAIAGLLLAAACGKDATGPDPDTNPDPQPVETAIEVQNQSQYTFVGVYIKSCSADDWGDDRYAGALAPSQNETFKVSAGCYDVAVVTSDGLEGRQPGVNVSTGETVAVPFTND